jgi:hypothetical protein
MTATCFRCDWAGETGGAACPSCGAPLYHAAPRERDRRAGPRRADMDVERADREAAEPRPVPRPRRASPGTILLAAGAVFALIVFLLARGGLDLTPGPISLPGPVPRTGGRLIYTVPVREGLARVWRWNLVTDQVTKGPLIEEPIAFVNVRSAGYGWLGITSEGGGGREASLLDSLDPNAATERVGGGDIVTWTRRGDMVLLVERGPVRGPCRRSVEVTAVEVGGPGRETVLDDAICGDVLSVGRTSLGYVLTLARRHGVDVVGAGYEDAGVVLRDHGVIDVSPGGQMIVTQSSEFFTAGSSAARFSDGGPGDPPLRVSGDASSYRLFGGPPVDLFADAAPLRIERVLAYTAAGTRALVIGSQGPDRPALWEVAIGMTGSEPGIPRYVGPVRGFTAAAYANDGTAFILTDARLWHFRDQRLTALEVPDGAPAPAGPLAWIVREPLTGL